MKLRFLILILMPVLLSASCKEKDDPIVPRVSFADYSAREGSIPQNTVLIPFTLSQATTAEVVITWSTEDGTAKAGSDYTAVTNAFLKFMPGETSKNIEVKVMDDNIFEVDEDFFVKIKTITNGTLLGSKLKITLQNDDPYTPTYADDGFITPDSYPGMTLAWADEFNGTGLNTGWWNYEKGNNNGWGNNELQSYTDLGENSAVKDGYLTITALKKGTNDYTSARITTKGKKEFTYGRIDIRAKLPAGQGIWPALWMLGGNISAVGWPACGEIDIMEFLGHDLYTVYGTVHYDDNGHKSSGTQFRVTPPDDFSKKFHVFTLIWQPGYMEFYVDYQLYHRVTPASIKYTAFTMPQFFIFNVAVGGIWPGVPDASTTFPQQMVVDYVRVFQQ